MSKRKPNPLHTSMVMLLLFGLGSAVHAAEQVRDGPYVIRTDDGHWISHMIDGGSASRVDARAVAIGAELTISAVGSVPSFKVKLRPSSPPAPSIVDPKAGVPILFVADTHGELEIAVELLRQHRIVDDALRWTFGKGHVVILGDVFDRGPHQTELLWLFYKLEAEAHEAGGGVHLLIGNHEALVLLGDERYLHPKYPRVAAALGASKYAALWGPRSLLGEWLRSKAAVMKIGHYLSAHGGISPQAVDLHLTVDAMNEAVRDTLRFKQALPPTRTDSRAFVMGPLGPLWYRGYFTDQREQGGPARATTDDIVRILDFYRAKTLVVGHTRVATVTPLYEGRVVAVQVYPHRHPQTGAAVMEALMIKDERLFKATANGSLQPLD